jgi:hypothetical protein
MNTTGEITQHRTHTARSGRGVRKPDYFFADVLALIIARRYESRRGPSYVSVGNVPQFDIRFQDKSSYEVKFDQVASVTGSWAIEYWNSDTDQPTGILRTESDFWIHCVPDPGGSVIRCYEVSTTRLLKFCLETSSDRLSRGGNNAASLLILIPAKDIEKLASYTFEIKHEVLDFLRT